MNSLVGSAWLDYMKRHLLVSFLSLSFHFLHNTASLSECLMTTPSLDSERLPVCSTAKVFRGSVKLYCPNLSFFNIRFQEVERF